MATQKTVAKIAERCRTNRLLEGDAKRRWIESIADVLDDEPGFDRKSFLAIAMREGKR